MTVKHCLVGYDRQTDRQAVRFEIDDRRMDRAKRIACVPADDPEAVWSYPLSRDQARDLAELIAAEIDPDQAEFFLEAFTAIPPAGTRSE
jgi:hypothetical protein